MPDLSPAQQAVVDGFLSLREHEPSVDADTVAHITRGFRERTQWAVDTLDEAGEQIWVSKHGITTVLGCETRWQAPDDFSWSLPTAVGSVAHRAAELMLVGRMGGTPFDAVVGSIELIKEENIDFAAFIDDGPPAREAAVRADATAHVTSLVDGFPPMPRTTRTEQTFQATLGGRTILLNARPDLALGRPSGPDARSMLIDLKTGTPRATHADDLRFYALVFMLRWGAAPWRIGSYYATDGTWASEDVDSGVLEAAARRTSDAILKMAEIIASKRPPGITPSQACGWCVLRETCPGATEFAERNSDSDY